MPLSWSKNTPGDRCIWETITRSVPLTMNVPFGVIRGMSPMKTSCSLMSLTDFGAGIFVDIEHDQTQGHLQRCRIGHVALLTFLDVVFRFLKFVFHELQNGGLVEILDRKDRLEDTHDAFARPSVQAASPEFRNRSYEDF